MVIPNHHSVDNYDVEVHPSESTFKYNSESVLDPYITLIESFDDGEIDHLLELFHLEHDDYLLGFNFHMLQA